MRAVVVAPPMEGRYMILYAGYQGQGSMNLSSVEVYSTGACPRPGLSLGLLRNVPPAFAQQFGRLGARTPARPACVSCTH